MLQAGIGTATPCRKEIKDMKERESIISGSDVCRIVFVKIILYILSPCVLATGITACISIPQQMARKYMKKGFVLSLVYIRI